MFVNVQMKLLFQIELVVVVDVGKFMVELIYILEGDGMFVWQCYEQFLIIQNSIYGVNFFNLMVLFREVFGGNVVVV